MTHLTPDLVRAVDDALAALDATLEPMMEKFTPGPWSCRRSNTPVDGEYDFSINADGVPVLAEAFGRSADGGFPPAEANATLIAAAPELVEALQEARTWLSGWGSAERELEIIDAALAKAGVSP